MLIKDLKDMPKFKSEEVKNGMDSVSRGLVYWDDTNKVSCKTHRAMLCVSEDRQIWRCTAVGCREGAWLVNP